MEHKQFYCNRCKKFSDVPYEKKDVFFHRMDKFYTRRTILNKLKKPIPIGFSKWVQRSLNSGTVAEVVICYTCKNGMHLVSKVDETTPLMLNGQIKLTNRYAGAYQPKTKTLKIKQQYKLNQVV